MAKRPLTPKGIQRRLKTGPSAREVHGAKLTFMTSYSANGGSYGGEIDAHDIDEARFIAVQRGIGERVISAGGKGNTLAGITELLLRDPLTQKDVLNALHEATFMCWLGLEAGTITPREALSDGGLLHRLAHLALGIRDGATKRGDAEATAKIARELADRVPGWPAHPVAPTVIGTTKGVRTIRRNGMMHNALKSAQDQD